MIIQDLEIELQRAQRDLDYTTNNPIDDYSPDTHPTYRACLDLLEKAGQPGKQLELTQRICDHLGNPEKQLRCVHVAGTNGKGSTCAYIVDDLIRLGCNSVGLYTSPHLYTACERIRVNFAPITQAEFVALARVVLRACEECKVEPKYSRCLTVMAFLYFVWKNVSICVIETGLGGEFDSTNVIPRPLCTVITTIHRDHESMLGPYPIKVAEAKAGILKRNCVCVCGNLGEEALKVMKDKAAQIDAKLTVLDTSDLSRVAREAALIAGDAIDLPRRQLPLSTYALQRRRQFVHVDDTWSDDEDVIVDVNSSSPRPRCIVMDVAHNYDACVFLKNTLVAKEVTKIVLVISVSRPRTVDIFEPLLDMECVSVYYMPSRHPRLVQPEEVSCESGVGSRLKATADVWSAQDASAKSVIRKAMEHAINEEATLVVVGSFFMMAEASVALDVPLEV